MILSLNKLSSMWFLLIFSFEFFFLIRQILSGKQTKKGFWPDGGIFVFEEKRKRGIIFLVCMDGDWRGKREYGERGGEWSDEEGKERVRAFFVFARVWARR